MHHNHSTILTTVLYVMGSICFLLGSLLSLFKDSGNP